MYLEGSTNYPSTFILDVLKFLDISNGSDVPGSAGIIFGWSHDHLEMGILLKIEESLKMLIVGFSV